MKSRWECHFTLYTLKLSTKIFYDSAIKSPLTRYNIVGLFRPQRMVSMDTDQKNKLFEFFAAENRNLRRYVAGKLHNFSEADA